MDALKDLHSEETERAALGCMFLDRSAAALGKTMLLADDFYTPMYRVIFEAMQGVEEIDAVTVMNELARRGEAERIGIDGLRGCARNIHERLPTQLHRRPKAACLPAAGGADGAGGWRRRHTGRTSAALTGAWQPCAGTAGAARRL